jgi:hypothetical protein
MYGGVVSKGKKEKEGSRGSQEGVQNKRKILHQPCCMRICATTDSFKTITAFI